MENPGSTTTFTIPDWLLIVLLIARVMTQEVLNYCSRPALTPTSELILTDVQNHLTPSVSSVQFPICDHMNHLLQD